MFKSCFVVTALCLMFAGSASAQLWSSPKLTTSVPFDFVVNGTILPAGTYIVMTYTTGQAVMIQNRDEPEYVKILNNNDIALAPYTNHEGTTLVFNMDNGRHVLHQIRLAGDNHTHDIIHGTDVAELVASR